MAHFATQENLKAFLNANQVTQLFSEIPAGEQEAQFTYADAVITDATGVVPVDPPGNDPMLVSIAARIVIWYLSGQQQWNESNKPELDRREKLYNDAVTQLEEYEAPAVTTTGPAFAADERRTEDW